ncbi:MAG: type I secretion C-terminal target domain-containing protein, partial [Rhodospirillales bacterium]
FHFDGSVNTMDDMDTITDFSVAAGDMVDLDALFEALGGGFTGGSDAADAAARAADVNIVSNVLTLDSHPDFSITFGDTSDAFADDTDGFTAAQLALLGIDVGV